MHKRSKVQECAKMFKLCKNVPIVHNTLRAEECAEGEVSFNSHYSQTLLFIHISFSFFNFPENVFVQTSKCIFQLQNVFEVSHSPINSH